MSKKILKRSLALGALMAFVITGQALAANEISTDTVISTGVHYHDGFGTLEDAQWNLGTNELWIDNDIAGKDHAVKAVEYSFIGGEGSKLKIEAGEGKTVTYGLAFCGDVEVDTLSIKASENALQVLVGESNIIAKDVTLESTNQSGIAASEEGSVTIVSDKLTVDAGDNGITSFSGGKNITVTTGELLINANKANDGGAAIKNAANAIITVDASQSATINGDIISDAKSGGTTNISSVNDVTINGAISINGPATFNNGGDTINVNGKNITIDAGDEWGVSVRGGYGGFTNETSVNIGTADTEKVNIKAFDVGLLSQYENSNINIYGKELNLEVAGDEAYGIYTGNNSECYEPTAEVNVYADQTKVTMTGEASSAVVAFSQSSLNIEGGLETSGGNAIFARGNSTVNVNTTGKGVVKLDGDIVFHSQGEGHFVEANNTINVNMTTADSYLNGKIYVANSSGSTQTYEDVTGMNLNLSNGATWNVKGDSFVNTLGGENGNIVVDMTKDEEGNEKITSVDILTSNKSEGTEVSGTGKVSDYLAANGKEAEEEFAKSVTDEKGAAIDTTMTTEEGAVGGAYTLTVNEDGSVSATQAVNTKSDAVSDAGMTLKGHWRAHMNDMNKRMGDLRNANGEHGVWTRMVRGESEYQGAKMQYNQYQLGYDEKLSVDKRWTVGAAVTFSEGDASYGTGSTDDKSTAFAIYGSKLNNDGTFVDLIARYAHLESDLDDRTYGTGDYSTNGMSVSAEFGKRIQQGNGLWIEPQVELTYGTMDSARVNLSEGFTANYDSMDSFIARAGFALGKDIKQGNVYARASYLYDFDGETETQFVGGAPIKEDFGGGWWEVGVGANINLSKATYIYADIEKTFGGEVDTNWQWNLGVRYSF